MVAIKQSLNGANPKTSPGQSAARRTGARHVPLLKFSGNDKIGKSLTAALTWPGSRREQTPFELAVGRNGTAGRGGARAHLPGHASGCQAGRMHILPFSFWNFLKKLNGPISCSYKTLLFWHRHYLEHISFLYVYICLMPTCSMLKLRPWLQKVSSL